MVAAAVVWYFYRRARGGIEAWLLVLTQVGLTASYGSQRAIALFQIAGLSFTPVDIFALGAVAAGILGAAATFRFGPRMCRQMIGRMAALCGFMVVPLAVAWAQHPETFGVAIRNMRSYVYLLVAIAYAAAVLRDHAAGSRFLTAMNVASAGASATQLGQALGLFRLVGFEERTFLLELEEQVRLLILPETLVPAFVAAAATSVIFLKGAPRQSGAVAMPLIVAAMIASPGRGAIFASVMVMAVLVMLSLSAGVSVRTGVRLASRARQTAVAAACVTIALLVGVGALKGGQEQVLVLRQQFSEGIAPWTTKDVVGRTNAWRAGLEMGLRSPVFGAGLGTRFPDLMRKHRLDSDFNFPGTLPNVFAKTGVVGVVLLGLVLSLVWVHGWRMWRWSAPGPALVAGPIMLAILLRSLSDDISQGFQFPIVVGVAFAAVVSRTASNSPQNRSGIVQAAKARLTSP